ncbi:competence/damage-inducible protein A [Flavilitoribacter nigricans]|uniref:CinA-like protein n=1 Tax=Flavilitoribacter nigricans (strain ATCC 23147 / DSM 23189 / NBRC 102662 / NCIMB 1420 / SS-2) TaxID=1122177 RepID=A0A2D0NHS7_FLAN2|nr:competence/damage-inducible protein A [Flavilitoribacter nigricans]PHN08064.1 competence/damage-inducible protein A [Flavilitoribacter nigricans DSM 23189 = NBRC 102662]
MTVHIITIGDEILIGQIVDTNSAWMGTQLNLIGAAVTGISTVGDGAEDIRGALERASAQADVVLMTGGLGPTKDDITKKVIADFFGVELQFHEPTYQRLEGFFRQLGRTPTAAHRTQCMLPTNAEVLTNKMGTAPGMWFEYNGSVIVSMPGVPYEMKYLMTNEVIPRLQEKFPVQAIYHHTLMTAGEGESRIAEKLEEIEDQLPAHIKLAYLPNLGYVRVRLSGTAMDAAALQMDVEKEAGRIRERLGDLIYGQNDESLEENLGHLLRNRKLTLTTAESCTGGYVAHLITSVAGSSDYFMGSIVAYANAIKQDLLGVDPATLETHGAVSEATVREMVSGALKVMKTDLAVAISGIAGPGGGSPEKPVGTIWMAVGNATTTEVFKLQSGKDRLKNIQYAGNIALNMVRKFVLKHY